MNFVFDLAVFLQISSAVGILIGIVAYIWRTAGRHRDMQNRIDKLEQAVAKVGELERQASRIDDLERRAEHRKQDTRMTLRGLVACLEGLREKGCNGKVTSTLKELNDYIMDSR